MNSTALCLTMTRFVPDLAAPRWLVYNRQKDVFDIETDRYFTSDLARALWLQRD